MQRDGDRKGEHERAGEQQLSAAAVDEQQLDLHLDAGGDREQQVRTPARAGPEGRGRRGPGHGMLTLSEQGDQAIAGASGSAASAASRSASENSGSSRLPAR